MLFHDKNGYTKVLRYTHLACLVMSYFVYIGPLDGPMT